MFRSPGLSIGKYIRKEDIMNRVKKTIRAVAMLVMVCMMLSLTAFAAGGNSVWLNVTQDDDQTAAYVVTDAAVTDGLIELTYDGDVLTYQDIETNEAGIAMFAVNTDEAGVVKISWVAPDDAAPAENQWLFKVDFEGTGDVTMSGSVNGGNTCDFATLDTSELEKVILEAEGLYEDNYTSRSWTTLVKALEMAREVLADPTADQSEVNAAAETLSNGIASLELKVVTNNAALYKAILRAQGLCEDQYTAESWAELEEALENAKAVNSNRKATQKQIDEATDALNKAIENLELKPIEPEEPEVPEEPETPTQPSNPGSGFVGKWIETIRDIIGKWFGGWGK